MTPPAPPPMITLRLVSPRIEHESVAWLQGLVNRSKYVRPKLLVDGVFGPATAQEVEALLYRLGAPSPIPAVGPETMRTLWRAAAGQGLPADWLVRRAARKAARFRRNAGITARSWAGLHPGASPAPGASLNIVGRHDLGLRPSKGSSAVTHSPDDGAVVHYQGLGRAALGVEAAAAQWRGFQRYHMDTLGWYDIGYNFGVPRGCPVGTVFEGRGFNVRGSHSGHSVANARIGILVGFGVEDGEPTGDQLATLEMFLGEYARGRVTGHLEWSPTSCPTALMMAWVRAQR